MVTLTTHCRSRSLIGTLYEPRENLIMITVDKETRKIEFYKKHEGDKIWHVRYVGLCGHQAVSFDKKKNSVFVW